MSKKSKSDEKVLHLRIETSSYKKLENEAKKYKRSIPNMARYLLEKRLKDKDFTDKDLMNMQMVGGIYSDLEDEEDIYNIKDAKPIKWD